MIFMDLECVAQLWLVYRVSAVEREIILRDFAMKKYHSALIYSFLSYLTILFYLKKLGLYNVNKTRT
jgi:hypothetical protein